MGEGENTAAVVKIQLEPKVRLAKFQLSQLSTKINMWRRHPPPPPPPSRPLPARLRIIHVTKHHIKMTHPSSLNKNLLPTLVYRHHSTWSRLSSATDAHSTNPLSPLTAGDLDMSSLIGGRPLSCGRYTRRGGRHKALRYS